MPLQHKNFFYLHLLIFAASCVWLMHQQPFPYSGLDEQGHVSYGLWLRTHAQWMPPLETMLLYDFAAGNWSTTANFINHSAWGYHILNLLSGEQIDLSLRYAGVILSIFGYGFILFGLNRSMQFSSLCYLIAAQSFFYLGVNALTSFYTNDAVAFLGGAIAFLGSTYAFSDYSENKPFTAVVLMLAGLALCLCAKLNAALLVGIYCLCLLILLHRRQSVLPFFKRPLLWLVMIACGIACYPYIVFWLHWGTPAPATPGQVLMLQSIDSAEVMKFPSFLMHSLLEAPFNSGPNFLLVISNTLFFGALVLLALWGIIKLPPNSNLWSITLSVVFATAITFTAHILFSYQRHMEFGWRTEIYPRYYFSLLGPYCWVVFGQLQLRFSRN